MELSWKLLIWHSCWHSAFFQLSVSPCFILLFVFCLKYKISFINILSTYRPDRLWTSFVYMSQFLCWELFYCYFMKIWVSHRYFKLWARPHCYEFKYHTDLTSYFYYQATSELLLSNFHIVLCTFKSKNWVTLTWFTL